MNRRYRKTIIAGNWKMNKTPSETKAFAEQFKAILPKTKWCDIVVCVPTVDLSAAVRAFKDSRIAVGAEKKICGFSRFTFSREGSWRETAYLRYAVC